MLIGLPVTINFAIGQVKSKDLIATRPLGLPRKESSQQMNLKSFPLCSYTIILVSTHCFFVHKHFIVESYTQNCTWRIICKHTCNNYSFCECKQFSDDFDLLRKYESEVIESDADSSEMRKRFLAADGQFAVRTKRRRRTTCVPNVLLDIIWSIIMNICNFQKYFCYTYTIKYWSCL